MSRKGRVPSSNLMKVALVSKWNGTDLWPDSWQNTLANYSGFIFILPTIGLRYHHTSCINIPEGHALLLIY